MVVAMVGEIKFRLKKDEHTVAYCEKAEHAQVVGKSAVDLAGNFKAVLAQNEAEAVALVRGQVQERLCFYLVDPTDFVFTVRTTKVAEDNTFWLVPGSTTCVEHPAVSEETSNAA